MNQKNIDIIQVLSINGLGWSTYLTDIESVFKICSIAIVSGYTAWKWYSDYKKKQKEDE